MTIKEVLDRVKADRPGEATVAELIKWLSDLDTRWSMEMIDTHHQKSDAYERRVTGLLDSIEAWVTSGEEEEADLPEPFFGYDEDTDENTELLVHSPDDEMYIYWLYSKIDVRLGEIARYNNDAMLFNAAWSAAARRYNRTHMPKGRNVNHIVYGSRPVPRPIDDPLDQRGDWCGWR